MKLFAGKLFHFPKCWFFNIGRTGFLPEEWRIAIVPLEAPSLNSIVVSRTTIHYRQHAGRHCRVLFSTVCNTIWLTCRCRWCSCCRRSWTNGKNLLLSISLQWTSNIFSFTFHHQKRYKKSLTQSACKTLWQQFWKACEPKCARW